MAKRNQGGRPGPAPARPGRTRRGPRGQGRSRLGPASAGRDLLWALALTLLAWVQRLLFLQSNRDADWPFTVFYSGDSETFFRYARALLAGQLYDNGIPFHPPGFPTFLAFVHTLVGADAASAAVPHAAVKSVLALVASLMVGLLYLLIVPYLGRTVALVAALLAAFHFGLAVVAIAPVSEGLYLTLLTAALLLWSRRFEHPLAAPGAAPGGAGSALALGLLLGILALVRAEAALLMLLLVGSGLWGWLAHRRAAAAPLDKGLPGRLAGLRPWALVLAGWLLAVAPWTARNAVRLAEVNRQLAGEIAEPLPTFVPLTIYGPLNLALANNPTADGTFSRDALAVGAEVPVIDLRQQEHLRVLLHGDALAWDYALGAPGDFARLVLRKWTLYFGALRLGWTQWDWPGGLAGWRRPVDMFVPDSGAAQWLTVPLVLLGLVLALGSPGAPRRWAGVVLLLTAAGLATTALFFGYARLGLLLVPFWLSLAAAGLVWLGERAARRGGWGAVLAPADPPRRLLQALAGAVVVLLALEIWGVGADRNFHATGTNVPGQRFLNQDEDVYLEPAP